MWQMITHSIEWFWTTGIHQADWVQAITNIALLCLTLVTLFVLAVYAFDTHTLAKMSVEQITMMKRERDIIAMRNFHVAYDCFMMVQLNLNTILETIVEGKFGAKTCQPIYPINWPDVTSYLMQRTPKTSPPAIKLGISLQKLDVSILQFYDASNNDEKRLAEIKVREALTIAGEDCKKLFQHLVEYVPIE